MRYKVEFKYRYGKDEQFIQPLNSNGKPLLQRLAQLTNRINL